MFSTHSVGCISTDMPIDQRSGSSSEPTYGLGPPIQLFGVRDD